MLDPLDALRRDRLREKDGLYHGNRQAQNLAGTDADATKMAFAKMATELMVDLVQAILVQPWTCSPSWLA